jgi:hypothetical protein
MKTIKVALPFVLALLLGVVACDQLGIVQEPELGSPNQGDYGRPFRVHVHSLPHSQTNVSFGLVGDTHIDASNAGLSKYCDTPNMKRNRKVIDYLNKHLDTRSNCYGIVHLGDMVNHNTTQNLNKAVFPTLGNHDVPVYHDRPHDWHKPADYIRDLIKDAPGIASYFDNNSGAYAWRWGQYYFIVLGLWAGSGHEESESYVNYDKLHWLIDCLEDDVGDSGLGVLIFQHYGWDSFSKDGDWWSSHMRNLELDVLMRRDLDGDSDGPGNPYNVLGIFTGHCHERGHIAVPAGKDSLGNDVHFDNYFMDDAGANSNYGFSIVDLFGDSMVISTKRFGNPSGWIHWSKPIHIGPEWDR